MAQLFSESARLKGNIVWTMNGIQLPEDDKRGRTSKEGVPERIQQLSSTNQKRVLVLRNGIGLEHNEIVVDAEDFQQVIIY